MKHARSLRHAAMAWLVAGIWMVGDARAGDWPQWRHDASRTAETPERLPAELRLEWTRDYPALTPAYPPNRGPDPALKAELHVEGAEISTAIINGRVAEFDAGYKPIVSGPSLFVASSRSDRVTALDVATGRERWRFYANGPVRYAPVAHEGKVIFGSDDGNVYCLDAQTGRRVWTFQAAPIPRQHLGNQRLVSVWPVRGGPVLHEGRLYLGAGNWPFEGVFYYCLDADTGKLLWENSTTGHFFRSMNEESDRSPGGPIALGYFLVDGAELVTPSGRDRPVRWDRATGELIPSPKLNAMQQHHAREGGKHGPDRYALVRGKIGEITAGGTVLRGHPQVKGKVHDLLAAAGRLFVVTEEGRISCFGAGKAGDPPAWTDPRVPLAGKEDRWRAFARQALGSASGTIGYCLVLGAGSGRLAEEILLQSLYQVVVVDPDPARVDALRRRFDAAGLYGTRVAVQLGDPLSCGLPPYLARLIVSEDPEAAGIGRSRAFVRQLFFSLRPLGGVAVLPLGEKQHAALAPFVQELDPEPAKLERVGEMTLLRRPGPIAGSANARGFDRRSEDTAVKGPMGVLWYGGELDWQEPEVFYNRHAYRKEFPPASTRKYPDDVVNGEIRIYGPLGVTFVDAYTGQVLRRETEGYVPWHKGGALPSLGDLLPPPEPASAGGDGKPARALPAEIHPYSASNVLAGTRRNPLTGAEELRTISRGVGCGFATDWGDCPIVTFRSGSAAYYDKTIESGTIHLTGVRAGCITNVIPANGLLVNTNHSSGCGCNYALSTSVAFAPTPVNDMWTAWGPCINYWTDELYDAPWLKAPHNAWNGGKGWLPYRERWDARTHNKWGMLIKGPIQRAGINLGAPADRMSPDGGTLWLDHPSIGGPSPEVEVAIEPASVRWVRRHSFRVTGGRGYRFVAATCGEGIRSIRTRLYCETARTFTVRLHFAEYDAAVRPGDRVFSVAIQGKGVGSIDAARESGGANRGLVKEYTGIRALDMLTVTLKPTAGRETILSGIEIAAEGVTLGPPAGIPSLTANPWLGDTPR